MQMQVFHVQHFANVVQNAHDFCKKYNIIVLILQVKILCKTNGSIFSKFSQIYESAIFM